MMMKLHTVIYFQAFLFDTNNLYQGILFQGSISIEQKIICLYKIIWYQIFHIFTPL